MMPMCPPMACNPGMMPMSPIMVPLVPMAGAPMMCAPNNMNMCSTTMFSEYDSQLYGRFRHVEREHPMYRHAPFDWYRPPKQRHNIVHEDAAVVTMDGPVPLGDFYRHYIYGEDSDEYDDDYEEDEYGDSSYFGSEIYDDVEEPSYERRTSGYGRDLGYDDDFQGGGRSRNTINTGPNANRRTTYPPRATPLRATRNLAGDDDFNDAESVNSTYGR